MSMLSCSRADMMTAAVRADQAGNPGVAELLRRAAAGAISLAFVCDREAEVPAGALARLRGPAIVVIGDDDYASTGPSGFKCAPSVTSWADAAVVHAAGATAESYGGAADAAGNGGRIVLVETDFANAHAWASLFQDKQVLLILPREGAHPISPARESVH